jgi:hypothetical protein
MAVSSSSLGLAWHFNPKRGGTKAQQTVIWAMKLAGVSAQECSSFCPHLREPLLPVTDFHDRIIEEDYPSEHC